MRMEEIIDTVAQRVEQEINNSFEIEASGRHIHLSREAVDALFGEGYELTPKKYLSQPGQYAATERISIIGPSGVFHNVSILGPVRKESQVEVSLTDARALGAKAKLRLSGDTKGTAGIILMNGSKIYVMDHGLIVAKRHIHVNEKDAKKLNVTDQEVVKVQVNSERPLIFDDVVVRISPKFRTFMHIDYDEANACGFTKGTRGRILR
ncbi:ethanolamine utilization phosphate acetyltransferase EutD [Fundicoccus culcitae]|uniref:Phosphate propanoyltransferase n=1 Tax=Fundicoccus culcitae TaxID=2969821 RepID=A0ABY5P4G6_9LACT|nr:ethanolamine utilization phosphate acetyltransferase EutD [Fundicoccus culcitae]UUX33333.1 ethanolamine utilization phosphate acetyltransferase EutD [Fundicoccus culcitae]